MYSLPRTFLVGTHFEDPCTHLKNELAQVLNLLEKHDTSFDRAMDMDWGEHLGVAIEICDLLAYSSIGYLL